MLKKMTLLFITISLFTVSCVAFQERIPPGYVGMTMTPKGVGKEILNPGNHNCWGRDRMVLIETKELSATEKLSVLCADDLNFKFDLVILSSIKQDPKSLSYLVTKQGSAIDWDDNIGKLRYKVIYSTYLRPIARNVARTTVSKYQTTQIRENREEIQKQIQKGIFKATKNLPIKLSMITTANFDYPDIITTSMEKKRTREIQLKEEKAKQAIELLKATNRLKIAQKMKIVRIAEAEAESAYIKIVGGALNPFYLKMRAVEAKTHLYKKVGKGDKVIVTNENNIAMPILKNKAVIAPR